MGFIEKLGGELIDIIEWTEPPQSDVLAYRFPRYHNEIKMGAKLVVREGQNAVFVNEGRLADVFMPGTYTLSTRNMPILTTLMGWKYGFNSPFKAEVYFISMRQWTDRKWGTQNPIMMRDPEVGPVRIRAFGTYAFHVADPKIFLQQLVVTDPSFESYEISNQLRDTIVSRFADVIGPAKIPVLDLAGNYDKIGKLALETIGPDLKTLGLALTLFYIENISLPPEVEEALDTRTKMGVLGDMNRYAQYQSAKAIDDAANNPGGAAGAGIGIGAGIALGQQMGTHMNPTGGPPPLPPAFFIAVNGAQTGPFDMNTLAAKTRDGSLTRETLVWRQGMAEWTAAGTVTELQPLFAGTPPPLPKG
ncbi:MAG TPA: SPFH domain-containing protein [Terriglobia bacterium]|nr:SPFH domain-containing protein [Terriglobia bacterium]